MEKIRVYIIDDSVFARDLLREWLSRDSAIDVIGAAPDPYVAAKEIIDLRPDVITLDIEMPGMNGIEFLKKLMPQYPVPVVMVSSLTQEGKLYTIDALNAGAVDFISKPDAGGFNDVENFIMALNTKIKIASVADVSHWKAVESEKSKKTRLCEEVSGDQLNKIIAIGASLGGPDAIKRILIRLPSLSPAILVVQHMPEDFTQMFASRLNSMCRVRVKEADTGDGITPGTVLVAPGGYHMTVKRVGADLKVNCERGDRVNGYCPSVEVLFKSVAKYSGRNAIGIILTGIGKDGAQGMLEIKNSGGYNIAQNMQSSTMFRMPESAIKLGVVHEVLHVEDIADRIISGVEGK